MKLNLYACLVVGALSLATQTVAAPIFAPFLAVDIDGYNADGGQSIGPTQAGFQGFTAAQDLFADPSINWPASGAAGLTNVYGPYTVNIKGFPGATGNRAARNRGANAGAQGSLTQDFLYAERGTNGGFGQHWFEVTVSGLNPGETYEFTGYSREPFNGGVGEQDASYTAWSDRARLGGLDGPGPWMDANVGPGALYGPVYGSPADPMTDGIYKNPIPTAVRQRLSGPDSADPYAYAATFNTTADGSGVIEVYGWGDPQSFSGTQTVSLLNGFQLAQVPEPASLALVALGMLGLSIWRKR
jgi:hypothetical protein